VYQAISEAGWHFSFLGGLEKIKYKIQSFAHLEFAKEEFWNDENILKSMEKGEDIFRRPGVKYKFYPLSYYPPFLRKLMLEYPTLLHLKRSNPLADLGYGIRRFFKGQQST
jgi:beta-1,4-mannosyl-glycoprotein beta-1,4-N-acetylglucosaminyltransferase